MAFRFNPVTQKRKYHSHPPVRTPHQVLNRKSQILIYYQVNTKISIFCYQVINSCVSCLNYRQLKDEERAHWKTYCSIGFSSMTAFIVLSDKRRSLQLRLVELAGYAFPFWAYARRMRALTSKGFLFLTYVTSC